MIMDRSGIWDIIDNYDMDNIHIGTLGGHSALDICSGAKKLGFKTVVVCRKGREKTYENYYRSREGRGCVDDILLLNRFSDVLREENIKKLRELNTIFIESRYLWVYFEHNRAEEELSIPVFGNRSLLKTEERDVHPNQYDFLDHAGIRTPKRFHPGSIDRLCIVKAPEAFRGYERGFFFADSHDNYMERARGLVDNGRIKKGELDKAVIEEYVLGAQVNFNFFYSPISEELEIMGTDMRRQTNLDGILRLPAGEQMNVLKHESVKYVETGHVACTVKESLLEKTFDAGERFVSTMKREMFPGIIGPFALQGAVTPGPPEEELVVFDVSMRIPGSPGIAFTPYTGYLYGRSLGYGERISMEIKNALEKGRIKEVIT